ncbi:MAG: hypothetical protein NT080_03830 [Spirochaetes bacterium]|nr:hypothetical protein [Spirochaetota bacterium]
MKDAFPLPTARFPAAILALIAGLCPLAAQNARFGADSGESAAAIPPPAESSAFAGASEFESLRPEENLGAIVAVSPFEPADDRVAQLVTEIMRTGLARSGFLHVVDESARTRMEAGAGAGTPVADFTETPDYRLGGSVRFREDGLVVSYMLVETLTSRVIQAESADIAADTFIQDIEALAAGIGNAAIAAWAGATEKNVRALTALGRYEEAERRLEAFQARNPFDPSVPVLRDALRAAVAARWFRDARDALAAAGRAKGEEAWTLASRARDDAEAAIVVLPSGKTHEALRNEYADFLESEVNRFLARTASALRSELLRRADVLRKSGDPKSAIALIDDYLASEGVRMADRELVSLRKRSVTEYARYLAKGAETAYSEGDRRGAAIIVSDALSQAPDDPAVAAAYERIRRKSRFELQDADLAVEIGHDSFMTAGYSSWGFSLAAGFQTFGEGTLDLPLSGVLPFAAADLRAFVTLADPLRLVLSAEVSRAASSGEVSTQGYPGELSQEAWGAELGAEGLWVADRVTFGLKPSVGAAFVRYEGSYSNGMATESMAGWQIGPGARIEGRLSWYLSQPLSFDLAIGPSWHLFPSYGIVGGFRIATGCSLSFR